MRSQGSPVIVCLPWLFKVDPRSDVNYFTDSTWLLFPACTLPGVAEVSAGYSPAGGPQLRGPGWEPTPGVLLCYPHPLGSVVGAKMSRNPRGHGEHAGRLTFLRKSLFHCLTTQFLPSFLILD